MKTCRQTDGERRPAGSGRLWRRLTAAAAAAGLLLAAGACAAAAPELPQSASPSPSPSPSPTVATARISIKPGNGVQRAQPQRGLEVTVRDGTIVSVKVRNRGEAVFGKLDSTSTRWHSRWALPTDTQFLVRATAIDAAGRTVTKTVRFRTLDPETSASATIFQGGGSTYGVGMPVILEFGRPVSDKKAVEGALALTTSKHIVGAWYWESDSKLYFRPRAYWPAKTDVSVTGHFDGVQISPGVYLTHTLRQRFRIGRSLIVVVSAAEHRMQVYLDRHRYATWPISTGRPGKETPNGTYLSIYKQNPAHMVGPDYDIMVPYSVLFTWGGDFIHAAPWSVGVQGYANVSHGCVNLSPERAATYYGMSITGDPVTVSGSPKAGTWGDGWTIWFLSWTDLLKGSALHKAVRAGPDGSTWVRPGALKKASAKAPLGRPKPDNAAPY